VKEDSMPKNGVIERSALRVFERAIGGGLGRGNVGCVLARTGVGKTGFMIGLALDKLLQGQKVLHISTQESVDKVRQFYDQIYHTLASTLELDNPQHRLLDVERNRHILVYNRKMFTLQKLDRSVAFLKRSAHFEPDVVIMDGTPRFEKCEQWEIDGLAMLAQQWQAEVWTSSNTHREGQELDGRGVPTAVASFDEKLAVILNLEPLSDHIRVRLIKEHDSEDIADLRMEIDPKTHMLRWR